MFVGTDSSVLALSAASGRLLWERQLSTHSEHSEAAPRAARGFVYASTVGDRPGGRGALYALAVTTGRVRWRAEAVKTPWRHPTEAGGGGALYPPSSDGRLVYWGTVGQTPHGGTPGRPNGGSYLGRVLYTDSLVALDARGGGLRWYDQVTSHDVRGYAFQLPPVLGRDGSVPAVFGAGTSGLVIAWSGATHRRLWQRQVGVHRNDTGQLPARRVPVCPGLLGGVATPLAYAGGALFVPVLDRCTEGSASSYGPPALTGARGEFVALDAASGRRRWARRFPYADLGCATVARGVVFTSTFEGSVYAFDTRNGRTLWRTTARAGIDSCPTLAANELLVAATVRQRAKDVLELTALGTRS